MKLLTNATAPHLTDVLHDLAGRISDGVSGSAGCGISLLTTDGRRITSVATDPVAERINALQDLQSDNPVVRAWRHSTIVLSDQVAGRPRSTWDAMVRELGVPRVLVAPLCTADRRLGSVLVYSTDPAAYRGVEETTLVMMAHEAAAVIDETQNLRICA